VFKGTVARDFDLQGFSSNNPLRAPDSRVKAFCECGFEFAKLFDKVGASAVLMAPLMQPVKDTAEAIWHRWGRGPRIREALAALKKNINKKNYIGKFYYPTAITITQKYRGYLRVAFCLSGVIDTIEAKIDDSKSNIFANSQPNAKRF
jgi:hypothetical protein